MAFLLTREILKDIPIASKNTIALFFFAEPKNECYINTREALSRAPWVTIGGVLDSVSAFIYMLLRNLANNCYH